MVAVFVAGGVGVAVDPEDVADAGGLATLDGGAPVGGDSAFTTGCGCGCGGGWVAVTGAGDTAPVLG